MRKFITLVLLVLISSNKLNAKLQAQKPIIVMQDINNPNKPIKYNFSLQSPTTIELDVGEVGYGKLTILNVPGKLHIEAQVITSMNLMDDGPHLDLVDWKHHQSEWYGLKKDEGSFLFEESRIDFNKELFSFISKDELINYLKSIKTTQRWINVAKKCTGPNIYPCGVGISHINYKIYKVSKNNNKTLQTSIKFVVPMGC